MSDILIQEHTTIDVPEGEYILQGDALRILRENKVIPMNTISVTGAHVEFTGVYKRPRSIYKSDLALERIQDAESNEQTTLSVTSDKENGDGLNGFSINRFGKDVKVDFTWIRIVQESAQIHSHPINYSVSIESQKKGEEFTVEFVFNKDGLIFGVSLADGTVDDYIYVDEERQNFVGDVDSSSIPRRVSDVTKVVTKLHELGFDISLQSKLNVSDTLIHSLDMSRKLTEETLNQFISIDG